MSVMPRQSVVIYGTKKTAYSTCYTDAQIKAAASACRERHPLARPRVILAGPAKK